MLYTYIVSLLQPIWLVNYTETHHYELLSLMRSKLQPELEQLRRRIIPFLSKVVKSMMRYLSDKFKDSLAFA
jgi:hypothetical protein